MPDHKLSTRKPKASTPMPTANNSVSAITESGGLSSPEHNRLVPQGELIVGPESGVIKVPPTNSG